jgi:hypothetical protein
MCCECRTCPGRHLADATLWIEIASMLSVFTFSLAKDKEGRDIDVSYATVPEGALVSLVFLTSCLVAIGMECGRAANLVGSEAPTVLPLLN